MADIFISYANEDRDRACILSIALEARGWSVWWDRKIVAGQAFDLIIEHELETAKSVVVLWSKSSINSEWVKNEAAAAAERSVLVPALIDAIKQPLEFRRKHTANLIGWDGDPSQEGFQALCDGVATAITGMAPATPTSQASLSGRRQSQIRIAQFMIDEHSCIHRMYTEKVPFIVKTRKGVKTHPTGKLAEQRYPFFLLTVANDSAKQLIATDICVQVHSATPAWAAGISEPLHSLANYIVEFTAKKGNYCTKMFPPLKIAAGDAASFGLRLLPSAEKANECTHSLLMSISILCEGHSLTTPKFSYDYEPMPGGFKL